MSEIVKGITQLLNNSNGHLKKTEVENLVDLACNPHLVEPDLAMNLELCDLIKSTQKNAPREAAMAILDHAHSRDQHEAMLALHVLDCCVKNCGFPFHFQIASKEFLNELFKRFPEKPPPVKTPVQEMTLDLLQQWNTLLYETSKYRKDLAHINDMYRLLLYKGYHFPEVRTETANVMRDDDTLKTKEEMEQQDRMAQSAKLQELLRRATPADLQAANDLMKVMAGYYPDSKKSYEQKETEELDRIEEKANKLRELLNSIPPGTNVADNDNIQELLSSVKTSQPKIAKWIEDNVGDNDVKSRVDRMLFLNDIMNEVMTKYDELKKLSGKVPIGQQPPAATNSPKKSGSTMKQEISLIDLDDWASNPSSAPAPSTAANGSKSSNANVDLLGDLSGLSFSQPAYPPGFGQGGAIQLSPSNAMFFSPRPNNMPLSHVSSVNGGSPSVVLQPNKSPISPGKHDMQTQSVSVSPGKQNNMIAQVGIVSPSKMNPLTPQAPGQSPIATSVQRIIFDKRGLKISVNIKKQPDSTRAECQFSNENSTLLSQLGFQVAVPNNMTLQMEPITGTNLPPQSTSSVMQSFVIKHPPQTTPKIRFKITFMQNNVSIVEQGEYQF